MARVTIVLDDELTGDTFKMTVDPPLQSLTERVKLHGYQSVSRAEGAALVVGAHMLEQYGPKPDRGRTPLIIGGN